MKARALAALLALGLALAPASLAQTPGTAPAARPAAPAAPARAGAKLDVNHATEQQLTALPGIGPARAKAVVAHRPYAELQELVTKKAVPQGVLDGVKDQLALANINTSTAAELVRTLPGIGEARAKAIVAGRPYASPQDLVGKGVLTQGVLDGIKELVTY